jgi:AcrR family transcriptional regulator
VARPPYDRRAMASRAEHRPAPTEPPTDPDPDDRGSLGARRARRSDGELTRARVLQAAVDCILERGYYRASSNAIARQAGVTWGAIAHQFGSREGLLLEVLRERWDRLREDMATATVTGETLVERLGQVLDVLEHWYGAPEHLVHTQILLDLSRDPDTSEATREAVAAHGRELQRAWRPLFVQAMGEAGTDRELVEYAFLTLRGYLSGNMLSSTYTRVFDNDEMRDMLVRGVACAVSERAKERDIPLR